LPVGRWRHLAGVHDGAEVRLYVDGALAARAPAVGPRRTDDGPLLVGAGRDAAGRTAEAFAGRIDDVRLSRSARYAEAFAPTARPQPDTGTAHCTRVQR
ncbi:MAG: LamG domain-containing protein, partial [Planctomycetota bacterium]